MVTKKNTAQKFETSLKELEEIVRNLKTARSILMITLNFTKKGFDSSKAVSKALRKPNKKYYY